MVNIIPCVIFIIKLKCGKEERERTRRERWCKTQRPLEQKEIPKRV